MGEITSGLIELNKRARALRGLLHLDTKEKEIAKLERESSMPNFWQDQEKAREVSRKLSDLKKEEDDWKQLVCEITDAAELAKEDKEDKGVTLRPELETIFLNLSHKLAELEKYALFDGEYDEAGAVVALHAGAGGTEAQDWVGMLFRMLSRYCEKKGWSASILDEHRGAEAGYKSIMFKVEGRYAYGHLKSEYGVHRLVRISPFDAEKMRHTSFALAEVLPIMSEEVDLKIDPKDLRIDTFMAGGHGGQSVNTTYSAVRVVHVPTGITVSCQNERSQLQNKAMAMAILKAKLHRLELEKFEKEKSDLRGDYQSAEWGNQIRSYVLHPYKQVKDLRTRYETQDPGSVLDGELDALVEAYLIWSKTGKEVKKK